MRRDCGLLVFRGTRPVSQPSADRSCSRMIAVMTRVDTTMLMAIHDTRRDRCENDASHEWRTAGALVGDFWNCDIV